jgi:predicted RecB family endonuclease
MPKQLSPIDEDEEISENEAVMQNHMVTVQKALTETFDKQIQNLELIINNKDHTLIQALNEKKEIAIALYRTKANFQVLQTAISQLTNKLESANGDASLYSKMYENLLQEIKKSENEKQVRYIHRLYSVSCC